MFATASAAVAMFASASAAVTMFAAGGSMLLALTLRVPGVGAMARVLAFGRGRETPQFAKLPEVRNLASRPRLRVRPSARCAWARWAWESRPRLPGGY